ncbi:MAG: hypothetical protein NC131_18635, partial [Roseburia sp.]|nr:hypothetical protein [Roseburia sp.]
WDGGMGDAMHFSGLSHRDAHFLQIPQSISFLSPIHPFPEIGYNFKRKFPLSLLFIKKFMLRKADD